jgi:UDP-glucose 4-epimerase
MKVLITGIFGFLGKHLAERLCQQHDVVGVYHTSKEIKFSKNIKCYNDLESLDDYFDVIIMCHAAVVSGTHIIDEQSLVEINVDFTRKIVEKFPKAIKAIYVSSVAVLGDSNEILIEKTTPNPKTDYASSKLKGENEVLKNSNANIVRFSSIYGIGMKENTLIPNYCNQALTSKIIQVWGNGSRYQNYIHVDDAVSLIEKMIAFNGKITFPVLGVSSKEYTNDEVAKIIANETDSIINYLNEDKSVSYHYNNELTQKVLNWYPQIELKDGLKNYLRWKEKQF